MRFVNKLSYSFANNLTLQLKENHEKRRVYYYGFQVVVGGLVKTSLMVSISFLLGCLLPTLALILVFGSLRMLAGGYHMDTLGKCTLISLAMFLTGGVTAQYTYMYWSFYNVTLLAAISFVIALTIIYKWAPAENPNRPITRPEEIRRFRRLSIGYTFALLAIIAGLIYYDLNIFALAACFGILFEVFTITPLGHKFFENISGELDKAKKKRR